MAEQRIPSNPAEYPRWITLHNQRIMVKDHYHHSAMTGEEYDANAQLVVKEQPDTHVVQYADGSSATGSSDIPWLSPEGSPAISLDGVPFDPVPDSTTAPEMEAPIPDEEEITAEMLFGKK